MNIRYYRQHDREQIERIHADTGIDYKMPNLDGPEAALVLVVEHEGKIIAASMNRVIAETYLWVDPALDPRDKFTAIRIGQIAMLDEAKERGWRELIAMIPEDICKRFKQRLVALQWDRQRTGWQLWGRSVSKTGVTL